MQHTESSPKANRFKSFLNENTQLLTTIVFSILSSIIVLTFYVFVIANRVQPKIASVDLQSLMKDVTVATFKQMEGKSESQQVELAAMDIKSGALKIEQAIHNVSVKHHVVLIQKQNILSNNVIDYTNEVRNEIAQIK